METASVSDPVTDPDDGGPVASQVNRWAARLELRRPGTRFGIVLGLLVVTFAFLASGVTGSWVPLVAIILQGATLLAALAASNARMRSMRVASVLILLGLLTGIASLVHVTHGYRGLSAILSVALVAGAPVAIFRFLIRRARVDLDTVLGAICVYILFGMLFAYAYAAVGDLGQNHFFAQHAADSLENFIYFSFVTLTTVGYGDLTAAGGLGRAVAILEALTGQLYLVTVVALVVSQLAPRRPPAGDQS
jgi:hypothetical protein